MPQQEHLLAEHPPQKRGLTRHIEVAAGSQPGNEVTLPPLLHDYTEWLAVAAWSALQQPCGKRGQAGVIRLDKTAAGSPAAAQQYCSTGLSILNLAEPTSQPCPMPS